MSRMSAVRPQHDLPAIAPIAFGDFQLDVDYYLKTEYTDTFAACRELPALIEYVNEQLQVFIEDKHISKQAIKEAEARAYMDLKKGLWTERGYDGKPTNDALERAVALEETVHDAHTNYARNAAWVNRLSNLMISLQAKLDLVRSSEATRRKLIEENDRPTEES